MSTNLPEEIPVEYNPLVLEHFERPRNAGHFAEGADTIDGVAGSVGQGAMFRLSARVAAQRIAAVRFEAYGCPHCLAAGSWLSERLIGATCEDLRTWQWREAADALEFPAEKRGRLLILEDAVRALAAAWAARSYHNDQPA
jgi:NifU-like protein involved in Fe-S cluster formation